MTSIRNARRALLILPLVLPACLSEADQHQVREALDQYKQRRDAQHQPAPPPQYQPPPPQAYRPPPPPPPQRIVRRANLNRYCKARRYTQAGCRRNGRPVCHTISMGFNTTYVSKSANIDYVDVCRRQYRTHIYKAHKCRVECIVYR